MVHNIWFNKCTSDMELSSLLVLILVNIDDHYIKQV